jgi:hypothetical protein
MKVVGLELEDRERVIFDRTKDEHDFLLIGEPLNTQVPRGIFGCGCNFG